MASANQTNGEPKVTSAKPVDVLPAAITNYSPDAKPPSHPSAPAPEKTPVAAAPKLDMPQSSASASDETPMPAGPTEPAKKAPDPFGDLSKLALSQDFGAAIQVKKITTTVPVRKPNKYEFVRVHPDPAFSMQTAALVYKEDREDIYLVDRGLWGDLATEVRPVILYTTINRQNVIAIWTVKLPLSDGRADSWNESALEAVALAKTNWIRVVANMSSSSYDVLAAQGDLSEPQWPDLSFTQILRIAFKDRFIDSADHPVLKKLRGQL